jgi:hypothetical protein
LTNRISLSAFFGLLSLLAIPSDAQESRREATVSVGETQFDASGTGTAAVAAIRAALVRRWMLVEVSLSSASLHEQFRSVNTRTGVGEVQLQAQWPAGRVRPYVGLGGGWLHYFNNSAGRGATNQTASGSVGLRIPVSPELLLRGEFCLRGWNSAANSSLHNSAAEYTAGVGYAF